MAPYDPGGREVGGARGAEPCVTGAPLPWEDGGMSESFVVRPQGRFAVGCAAIFLVVPAVGTTLHLAPRGPLIAAVPVLVAAALFAAVYYVFSEEVRVTLDEQGLRLSRTRVLLGLRLGERSEWSIPLAALTHAEERHTKTPAARGGWNHSTKLYLPEGHTLDATVLGGTDEQDSAYNQLVRTLKKRLGAKFERETS